MANEYTPEQKERIKAFEDGQERIANLLAEWIAEKVKPHDVAPPAVCGYEMVRCGILTLLMHVDDPKKATRMAHAALKEGMAGFAGAKLEELLNKALKEAQTESEVAGETVH